MNCNLVRRHKQGGAAIFTLAVKGKNGALMQQHTKDAATIEDGVRAYIVESFLTEQDALTFQNDADLLLKLDSLQILRMVIALEKQYDIKVHESELAPEHLGSVCKIAAFIARKQVEKE
jgi:acyl carrier protein